MRYHDKVSVRIQHEDFPLSRLAITNLTPDLTRPGVKRPARRFERPLHRLDAGYVHLEYRAAPVGPIEQPGLLELTPLNRTRDGLRQDVFVG
jgi:hypothetical protein